MTTFALIHGGGGSAFDWHLVEAELRDRGHDTVAVDLPTSDPRQGSGTTPTPSSRRPARAGPRGGGPLVGRLRRPLVAERAKADALVMVTAMIPSPGETPADWWGRTGHAASGIEDEYELYLHDVPRELGERVLAHDRALAEKMDMDRAYYQPWPLAAWPDVPTRFLLCRDDRFFTRSSRAAMSRSGWASPRMRSRGATW
ncbi:alpha/beta hydrolase [Nonomuraea thailandensis]